MAGLTKLSRELSSTRVLIRFFLRISILVAFTSLASIGFARGLAALLWMSIILCAVVGTNKRERPLGAPLKHWDETVAYAAVFALVTSCNHALPV